MINRDLWTALHPLLSLDAMAPFTARVGVVSGSASLKLALRATLPDDSSISMLDEAVLVATQQRSIAGVARRSGPQAAERFVTWASETFTGTHTAQLNWSSWDIALRAWAQMRAELGPAEPFRVRSVKLVEAIEREAVSIEMFNAALGRLSDEDMAIYAAEGWAGSEEHPALKVHFMSGMFSLRRHWPAATADLTPAQRALLVAQAEAALDAEESYRPGPLTFPPSVEPATCL